MIGSEEIKRNALKWWKEILQCSLTKSAFFPREITRISKVKPSNTVRDFEKIQDELDALRSDSKEKKGFGYTVIWEEISNRKIGQNVFPSKIVFETLDDYLRLLKKEKDFRDFQTNSEKILSTIPELTEWVKLFPESVITHSGKWDDVLRVLRYFMENPNPDLYIRQLPIPVHTKFIEQYQALITSCLEFLIPTTINPSGKTFQRKFNLKYDEPLIRIRILDKSLAIQGLTDISIPINHFKKLEIACLNVIVTENKMNFLALPVLKRTIAIWSGGGFYVRYFSNVEWLKSKEIFYWGDIDVHGLLILDQMRSYFGHTKSIMMDWDTLQSFESEKGSGSPISSYNLIHLSTDERNLFNHLRERNLRLEQEKIPHEYSIKVLYDRIVNQ